MAKWDPSFGARVKEALGWSERDYLHYHWPNYTGEKKVPTYQDIQRIISSNKKKLLVSTLKNSDMAVTNTNTAKLEKILNDFSSQGTVGQKITEYLNEKSYFKNSLDDNNIVKTGGAQYRTRKKTGEKYWTEGGFFGHYEQDSPEVLNDLEKMVSEFNKALNKMIEELAKAEPSIALAMAQTYYGGKNIPQCLKGILPEEGRIKGTYVQERTKALTGLLNNIKEPLKMKNVTADDFRKAVESNMNQIGGAVGELLWLHVMDVGDRKVTDEADKALKETLSKSKGKWSAVYTGQEKIDSDGKGGKDVKSDIVIFYNENKFSVQIGGSIKVRNGQKAISSGIIDNLNARTRTIENGLRELEQQNALTKGFGEVVLGLATSVQKSQHWKKIATGIAATQIAEAISGLMDGANDTAALLLINNKIYSVPFILQKIINALKVNDLTAEAVSIPGVNLSGRWSRGNSAEVRAKEGEKDNVFSKAYRRNENVYDNIINNTISLSLNLKTLLK